MTTRNDATHHSALILHSLLSLFIRKSRLSQNSSSAILEDKWALVEEIIALQASKRIAVYLFHQLGEGTLACFETGQVVATLELVACAGPTNTRQEHVHNIDLAFLEKQTNNQTNE